MGENDIIDFCIAKAVSQGHYSCWSCDPIAASDKAPLETSETLIHTDSCDTTAVCKNEVRLFRAFCFRWRDSAYRQCRRQDVGFAYSWLKYLG